MAKTTSAPLSSQRRVLAARVAALKEELMRAGLVLTARAMEAAVRKVGWEVPAREDGTWPDLPPEASL